MSLVFDVIVHLAVVRPAESCALGVPMLSAVFGAEPVAMAWDIVLSLG